MGRCSGWLLRPIWVWPWVLHWLKVCDGRGANPKDNVAGDVAAARWLRRGAAAVGKARLLVSVN